MAISRVARPQGGWPAEIFYPFGHPSPCAHAHLSLPNMVPTTTMEAEGEQRADFGDVKGDALCLGARGSLSQARMA
jgi:hypothetical protein